MQVVVVVEATARKVEPVVAALVVVVVVEEIIPIPTVIIDKYQLVTAVTANQEPVVVVVPAAITEAFHMD